ncbi:hypothetical protein GOP47_0018934 [Adiantum capillus-veneris]|uniref:Uncharacterized protein n=1 Tax=Adiantum capillus-veneris TaxID=13818 RepID=A0A9D4ZA47_ADICA|nr:hypothetical protein GOP47_0018934 [Adiantum capillus-veneris]
MAKQWEEFVAWGGLLPGTQSTSSGLADISDKDLDMVALLGPGFCDAISGQFSGRSVLQGGSLLGLVAAFSVGLSLVFPHTGSSQFNLCDIVKVAPLSVVCP